MKRKITMLSGLLLFLFTGSVQHIHATDLDSVFVKRLKRIEKNIPLVLTEEVEAAIKKRMYEDRRESELVLSRSMEVLPIIEKELWQNEIPSEFKYLPVAVSDLNPANVDKDGCTGIWELQYITACRYGLVVNNYIDERRDVQKSTKAAIRYLADLNTIYHNWGLCLLAFVSSPAEVNSGIRRASNKDNLWSVFQNMDEPGKYKFVEFIAAAYLLNYYTEYDMKKNTPKKPVAVKSYTPEHPLSFSGLAAKLGATEAELHAVNPLLRGDIIPSGMNILLNIPVQYAEKYESIKDTLPVVELKVDSKNVIIDRNYYFEDNPYRKDNPPTTSTSGTGTTSTSVENVYHKVVSGDNLGRIAGKYHVGIDDLKKWNHLKSDLIYVGQRLIVQKKTTTVTTPKPTTESINTGQTNTPTQTTGTTTTTTNTVKKPTTTGGWTYYTVKTGDSVWRIANKHGITEDELRKNNNLKDNLIHPGQKLKIKKK